MIKMKNKAFLSKKGISKIFQKLPNKLVNFCTKFLPRLGNFRASVEIFLCQKHAMAKRGVTTADRTLVIRKEQLKVDLVCD